MRPVRPMRMVTRVSQSPLNATRWSLDLSCGHEVWITSRSRPVRKFSPCSICGEMQAGPATCTACGCVDKPAGACCTNPCRCHAPPENQ